MRYLIPLGMFSILLIFLYIGLGKDPRKLDSTLINKPMPVFNLSKVSDLNAKITDKDLLGKVTLLNVWASWCVTCRQEHPLLTELARRKVIDIYGLNWKDTLPKAKAWLNDEGNPYIASAFDPSGRAGIDYGVTGTPETFIIDKKGIVRYKHIGAISIDNFKETIWPIVQKLKQE
jgi:cytochrome c biogenesis protein CcmG/thiol:disulfide interchange protein DsbE